VIVLGERRSFFAIPVLDIPLLVLRDLIAPLVWAASFLGNRIYWRGDVFRLKDGRLTMVA
jgi:hypothetical protein